MAKLAEEFVEYDEIIRLEKQYTEEECSGKLTLNTQFQYACCLVQSRYKDDIRKGINIFRQLCRGEHDSRDFLFFLALGHYKLGECTAASKFIQRLLTIEPNNSQAMELKEMIDCKATKDGVLGLALSGGLMAVGVALLGVIFANKSK